MAVNKLGAANLYNLTPGLPKPKDKPLAVDHATLPQPSVKQEESVKVEISYEAAELAKLALQRGVEKTADLQDDVDLQEKAQQQYKEEQSARVERVAQQQIELIV